jgi:hypothetical protein
MGPLFSSARSRTLRADVRAIYIELRPVDKALAIKFQLQRLKHAIQQTFTCPAAIAMGDALLLAIAFRHVTPRRAADEHPAHAVCRGREMA